MIKSTSTTTVNTTTATTSSANISTNEYIERMSELSFHTLRKSLTELMSLEYTSNNTNSNNNNNNNNYRHHRNTITSSNITINTTTTTTSTINNNSNSNKNKRMSSTVPRRSLSIDQNMNILAESLPKRYPGYALPNSRTVPSFWSCINSTDEYNDNDSREEEDGEDNNEEVEEENDEEDEEVDEENKIIHGLSHSHSVLTIRTAIPRTGSLIHELSHGMQQQDKTLNKEIKKKTKNNTPISQIIPADRKRTAVSTIETLFGETPTLSFDNMLSIPSTTTTAATNIKKYGSNLNHLRKSAPTNSSSSSNYSATSILSSMILPPTLKRSTTKTSFKSTTTTTSSNSSSSSSSVSTTATSVSTNPSIISTSSYDQTKKDWDCTQFSYWFAPPPPLPSSIMTLNDSTLGTSKRTHVIQELLSTEKSYQTDMELVKEIYYEFAFEVLSKTEIKQIFINLLDIIDFEKEFIIALENACHCELAEEGDSPREKTTISGVFNQMMFRMDQIYGDYCKKHEDAVCKIQELSSKPTVQNYFIKCKSSIQGRTMCWDLPSLLIKPVQRILKYPLLLRELLSLTPEDHADHEQLVYATNEIQKVADHINEIKRRKDLVEQLINEKKRSDRNVVQGINKRFTRRVHRKKQFSTTQDAIFNDLYKQFEAKQEMARQFERGVQEWVLETKNNVHALSDLIQSLESVYGDSDGIGLRSMHAFKALVTQLQSNFMDSLVQKSVYDRIEAYLKLFKSPSHIIQKRNRKLLDYDRARHMMAKGEVPDKTLQQSVEAYVSLNAHLLEELPVFLSLTNTYFEIILNEFSRIQALYWHKTKIEWKMLTIELPFGKEHTWESIVENYKSSVKRLQPRMDEIQSNQAHS